jgi:hypothetical protein
MYLFYLAQEYASFHALQVRLYADFAPTPPTHVKTCSGEFEVDRGVNSVGSDFLSFLQGSSYAPLEAALRACESHQPPLYDEMVYILGKLGGSERALTILMQKIGSVRRAMEFVERQSELTSKERLWGRLIDFSLKNEVFLSGLLDYAGYYNVDVRSLIHKIPEGMKVDGLRNKLLNIVR